MAEFKLSYTAKEVNEKLTEVDVLKSLVGNTSVSKQVESIINERNGKPLEKVLLYYGYPIAIGGAWSVENAVNIYRGYDVVVLGDTYQDPEHSVYADTVAIIKKLEYT